MMIDEIEVHITADGLGRASIVRRADGLLRIYVHWIWPETLPSKDQEWSYRTSWFTDKTPPEILYEDVEPRPGLYGTVEDARREIRAMNGFSTPS